MTILFLISAIGYAFMIYSAWCFYSLADVNISTTFCMRVAFMIYSAWCFYSLADVNIGVGQIYCTRIYKTKSHKSRKCYNCYTFFHISTSSSADVAIANLIL